MYGPLTKTDRLLHAFKDWIYTTSGMVTVVIIWVLLVMGLLLLVVDWWEQFPKK